MPELPEVEVTRRSIDAPLRGALIRSVRVGKPLRWPLGRDAGQLRGLVVGAVQRRGKYLWLPLLPGAQGLLLHLGMSGSLALLASPGAPGPHDHFDLETDRGTLRLTDPRRFGAVVWSAALDRDPAARLLRALGAEPFDPGLTPAAFHAALARRSGAIKTVLLGGGVVVGAGNIYACEALFRAGVDPRLPAMRLSRPRAERLLAALRETLASALEQGGSSLRDFRDPHGASGTYQTQTAVYARAGQPCRLCAAPVRRIVQAQRSTYLCPRCQRR